MVTVILTGKSPSTPRQGKGRVVVDGTLMDGAKGAKEEEEGDVQVPKGQLMPHLVGPMPEL